MPIGGGPQGPGDLDYTTADQDPLAGLPRPTGDVAALRQAGQAYEAAGPEMETLQSRVREATGEVLGATWVSRAGATCAEATNNLAETYGQVAARSQEGRAILLTCATKWEQALGEYDRARSQANEALREEAMTHQELRNQAEAHRADGDWISANLKEGQAEEWVSPLRPVARDNARAAITAFDEATRAASRQLDELLIPAAAILTRIDGMMNTTATGAEAVGRLGYAYHANHPLNHSAANGAAVQHAARINRWIKGGGMASGFVSTAVAGYKRYAVDGLKHPEMGNAERVARAAVEGSTITAAGTAAGNVATASVGIGSWMSGPGGAAAAIVAGGATSSAVGAYVDRNNDAAVDAAGNFTEDVAEGVTELLEWTQDRLSGLKPWG